MIMRLLRLVTAILVCLVNSATTRAQQIIPVSTYGAHQPHLRNMNVAAAPNQAVHQRRSKQPGHFAEPATSMPMGNHFFCDSCGYSAHNPPAQPQVATGRCPSCNVAVDCADNCGRPQTARDLHRYNFEPLGHGEWMGPIRVPSTSRTRIRVGDQLRFIYMRSQLKNDNFRLQIRDQVQISQFTSETDLKIGDLVQGKGVEIQANGALILPGNVTVPAAGLTIAQLRDVLNERYSKFMKNPAIDVIPITTNSLLTSIINSVDARAGNGGQNYSDTVDSDGNVRLPKLGPVCVLGMTVSEIKREVNLRYREIVSGLEVEPGIEQEAPHFVYVGGAVARPDRFELTGPTTISQALTLAGGVVAARGNRRRIAIFRQAEDWRRIATLVDLAGMHTARTLTTTDDIWVRDSDMIYVPLTPIARFDDVVENVFTRGVYSIFPFAQVGEGFNANAFAN